MKTSLFNSLDSKDHGLNRDVCAAEGNLQGTHNMDFAQILCLGEKAVLLPHRVLGQKHCYTSGVPSGLMHRIRPLCMYQHTPTSVKEAYFRLS